MPAKRVLSALMAAAAFLVWTAGTAEARRFTMSAVNRHFCCTSWGTPTKGPAVLGGAPVFARGTVMAGYFLEKGAVTATGSAPATLTIQANVFDYQTMGAVYAPQPGVVYVKTYFDVKNSAGVLKKSGAAPHTMTGLGYYYSQYCIQTGPGPGFGCTAPANATGSPRNGRMFRKLGANKFGGTMKYLGGVTGKRKINYPLPASPSFDLIYFYAPFSNIGASPGALLTFKAKSVLQTPLGGKKGTTFYGTPTVVGQGWSTGQLVVSVTKLANAKASFNPQTVTVTGTDMRTPLGAGNITLVSGQLFNTAKSKAPINTPRGVRLVLTLSPKVPTMSTSGAAAAAALMLLAVGFALRRRI